MDAHFVLKDNINIQINSNNREFIGICQEYLTEYVEGYRYMKKYKNGSWNGRISLFSRSSRSFPYGLIFDVVRFLKKAHPEYKIRISEDVKNLFRGIDISDLKYDLKYYPYDYQKKCIEIALKHSKGIVVSCTSSGKSLMIAYILRNISHITNKSIIIVPNLSLVEQFRSDLIEYGFDESKIGIVNSKNKDFDKKYIISTWQSLKNVYDFDAIDCLIVDECHGVKATVISEVIQRMKNARFRYGFTGTMPQNRLDKLTVKQYLGPELTEITAKSLMDKGYISKCNITQIYVKYKNTYKGDYADVKNDVFQNGYRLGIFSHLIENNDCNILILVDKIKKEGDILLKYLKKRHKDKKIVFLSGRDDNEIREQWRKYMNEDKGDTILIASYAIFSTGINIPSLKVLVFGSSTKSYIRVIQSVGRSLRLHESKSNGSIVYDICDSTKYLGRHAKNRMRHYTKQKYNVTTVKINEKDGTYKI